MRLAKRSGLRLLIRLTVNFLKNSSLRYFDPLLGQENPAKSASLKNTALTAKRVLSRRIIKFRII